MRGVGFLPAKRQELLTVDFSSYVTSAIFSRESFLINKEWEAQFANHATVERRERRPGVPMPLVLYRGIVGMFPKSARVWATKESPLIERGCGFERPCEKASTCRSRPAIDC